MAQADEIVINVKSNIGEVTKETKELTNDFGAFGITIGGIKDKFKDVAKIMTNGLKQIALQAKLAGGGFKQMFSGNIIGGAKTLFTVIKTGIAATGIGALVIAFTSLVAFLTKTKKGAELLEVAFAGIGAAVSVIVDRVSKFGGAIVKLFKGDVKGALTDVKGAFTGIGTEIANDVKQAVALKKAFTALRDSERALNVETAQRRAEIEALKLIAEDVSKSETERLEAAKKAFQIENDLLDKRVANAEEALRIQQQEMSLGENMQEDLNKEAELLINLADIRAESTTKQIELNNKINSIEAEVAAKRKERSDARLQEIEDEKQAQLDAAKALFDAQMKQAAEFEARVAKQAAKEKAITKAVEDFKLKTLNAGLGAAAAMAGENTALSKGVAAAQVIYNTQQGIMAAMGATSVADKLIPYPLRLANAIATGVMGATALQKIMSTNPTAGSSSGSGVPSATPATPAPQMMSGAFDLSGGLEPEPTRAYVVTDEMTNSQNQLANIRRRATI